MTDGEGKGSGAVEVGGGGEHDSGTVGLGGIGACDAEEVGGCAEGAIAGTGTPGSTTGDSTINANVSYTPDAGFTGTDTFTYTVLSKDRRCETWGWRVKPEAVGGHPTHGLYQVRSSVASVGCYMMHGRHGHAWLDHGR